MKTAYIYARFSSDNQREESITAQIRAIHEFCDTKEIRIQQEFVDEAQSARSSNRPEFQRMFSVIRNRPADFLIVHKLDRFARNRYDAAFYRQKLKDANMKLISVLEPIDDSPESIIMEGLIESMNEYYSANLSRETKKGFKENIMKGKRCGARTPKGYDCVNQKLYPNEDAPLVKKLFQMYADGASFSQMHEELGLAESTMAVMLKNENYRGALVHGGNRFEHAHEAIIDEDLWNRVRKRMNDRKMNAANKAKHEYMLSGILYCAKCGRRMTGCPARGGYFYYRCKCQSVTQKKVEGMVTEAFSKYMAPTPSVKAKFYDLVNSRVNNREAVEKANKANQGLQKRIDKLMNALQYADEEQADIILKQARELKGKMVHVPKPIEIPKEACDAFIDSLSENVDSKMLRSIVTKVIYQGDSVEICLPDTLGAVSIP